MVNRKVKTYITFGTLVLLLSSLFFLTKSVILADNKPQIQLFAINDPNETWDSYDESKLQEIGCRSDEYQSDLPRISDLSGAQEFLDQFKHKVPASCLQRPLGIKAGSVHYVLRVSKNNKWISFLYDSDNDGRYDNIESFDIESLNNLVKKNDYYEISGSLNPESPFGRWKIEVKPTKTSATSNFIQFYTASDDLRYFNASERKFAGFLFFAGDTTSTQTYYSSISLSFNLYISPAFCSQDYQALMQESSGEVSIGNNRVISLNRSPMSFYRNFYALENNATTTFWLAEVSSKRQLTPRITLSMLYGSRGLDLGITDFSISPNIAKSGYATCVNKETKLIAEVTNNSDQKSSEGDISFRVDSFSSSTSLGNIESFSSKDYSVSWIPRATGTYRATISLQGIDDRNPDNNNFYANIQVYDECPEVSYYCISGFCYQCPVGVLPPSYSCQLVDNQECINAGIQCESQKIRE